MPKDSTKPRRKAAEKSEKATRGGKAKKDPKAPKRAMSAYMFFSQDWRERIKAENPDAGFGEIGRLLGTKWKELDDKEKKPYIEQAAKDKTRAEDEKTAYDGSAKKTPTPASGDEEAGGDGGGGSE
ncbi:high mobility group box domain-containing protein [Collybia nuda]|uniref:High mobility group box domain-containing protein n=1 Tax=Collybia nuda TaxID=64659 RepID=A0A9P5Y929_9AGAR|nr:high mobility group box domain-containing protein [Collybia nuda]